MAVKLSVELSGPFFQRDPARTMGENIQAMLEGLAEEGEGLVRTVLTAGESSRAPIARIPSDRVSEHVVGRVHSLSGKHWTSTAIISVNNSGFSRSQGISLMAAAAGLEARLHAFRRTATALRRARSVLTANLTKGIE